MMKHKIFILFALLCLMLVIVTLTYSEKSAIAACDDPSLSDSERILCLYKEDLNGKLEDLEDNNIKYNLIRSVGPELYEKIKNMIISSIILADNITEEELSILIDYISIYIQKNDEFRNNLQEFDSGTEPQNYCADYNEAYNSVTQMIESFSEINNKLYFDWGDIAGVDGASFIIGLPCDLLTKTILLDFNLAWAPIQSFVAADKSTYALYTTFFDGIAGFKGSSVLVGEPTPVELGSTNPNYINKTVSQFNIPIDGNISFGFNMFEPKSANNACFNWQVTQCDSLGNNCLSKYFPTACSVLTATGPNNGNYAFIYHFTNYDADYKLAGFSLKIGSKVINYATQENPFITSEIFGHNWGFIFIPRSFFVNVPSDTFTVSLRLYEDANDINNYKSFEKEYKIKSDCIIQNDTDLTPSVINYSYDTNPNTNISLIFNKNMSVLSFTNESIIVNGSFSGHHYCTFLYDRTANRLTIDPIVDFSFDETITVQLSQSIRDTYNNMLGEPYAFNFNTRSAPISNPSGINVTLNISPLEVEGGSVVTVSGTAKYNTQPETDVPTATALITVANTRQYTASVSKGSYSRPVNVPYDVGNYLISVMVEDGLGLSGTSSEAFRVSSTSPTGCMVDYIVNCSDQHQNSDGNPHIINPKDYFSPTESGGLYTVMRVTDLSARVWARTRLYNPDGSLFESINQSADAEAGWDFAWWYYGWDQVPNLSQSGEYNVRWYLRRDGSSTWNYVGSRNFVYRYKAIEHFMCKDVQQPDGTPINITNTFSPNDQSASTLLKLKWLSEDIGVRWVWYPPDGTQPYTWTIDPVSSGNWEGGTFTPPYEDAYLFGKMDIAGYGPSYQCGTWRVEMFIKDPWGNWKLEYTDHFLIEEKIPPQIQVSSDPVSPIETQPINLYIYSSDNNQIDRIILHWNDGSECTRTWSAINLESGSFTNNIGSTYASGQNITYWAEIWDESGNRTESEHRTIIISSETITTPTCPSGNSNIEAGEIGSYITSGSITNLEHPVEYLFDWGDGTLSSWSGSSQNHSWVNAGIYYVRAKARCTINSNRESEWSTSFIITVYSANPISAGFTASPISGYAPLNVRFTDTSTGSPNTWSWDFGDGSSSSEQNLYHTYNTPGLYTVSLTVTSTSGTDTNTKTDYITVTEQLYFADFDATPRSGVSPHAVTFTDQSTGPITAWLWDFGDGTMSTSQNTTHTYNNPGTYTVSLTVSGPDGSDAETKAGHVTVLPPATPCECDHNHDGRCDMRDWLLFGQDWGRTNCHNSGVICECDLNDDGRCDMRDWLLFGKNWGKTDCPILLVDFALVDSIETGFGRLRGIDISPDDSELLAATWADTYQDPILIYSLPDYQLLRSYPIGRCHGDVVVSQDGQRAFATTYYSGTVSEIDLTSEIITDLSTYDSWPYGIAMSPDGRTLVALVGIDGQPTNQYNDGLALYNVADGNFEALGFVELDDEPGNTKVAFSPDSRYVYVGTRARASETARIYEISLTAPYGVRRYKEFSGTAIQVLRDTALMDNKLYVGDLDTNKIRVLDISTWGELTSIPLTSIPRALTTCPNSRFLYVLLPDERAIVAIEPNTGRELGRFDALDDYPQDIEFNSDGTSLFISHSNPEGSIIELEVNTLLTTPQWRSMSSGTNNDLFTVWGTSGSNVFAVGRYGTIMRYDGSTWSGMNSGTSVSINSVWGSSSSDVFAVGDDGTILHYNGVGSAWNSMSSGTDTTLCGVWGTSSSDVFAVGLSGVILHYDGNIWSSMPSGTSTFYLNDVWGSSLRDIFTIGTNGTIRHYNGSTWGGMTSGTGSDLQDVWGASASDVFAVGYNGTILHYTGSTWSTMNSGTSFNLRSIWGSSSGDVFATGYNGLILHYNGITWNSMSNPLSGSETGIIGVWGASGSDVFAVGNGGQIIHYGIK